MDAIRRPVFGRMIKLVCDFFGVVILYIFLQTFGLMD